MQPDLEGVVFQTAEGWCGLSWTVNGLRRLNLPRSSEVAAIEDLAPARVVGSGEEPEPWASLAADVRKYFAGKGPVDFRRYPVDLAGTAGFTRRVYEVMREIPWGGVVTYGELAAVIGNPAAARAVGQACARNPVAVVIPCHRVVGTTGLVGFGGGLGLKQRMLSLEGYQSHR